MHARVEAVRRFGRFYTRYIGALQEGLLDSPYPLPAARLIYEIAHHEQTSATELGESLGLDPGYVSRLLRLLHEEGIVDKNPSLKDRRVTLLSLTEAGNDAFARLNAASQSQAGRILGTLSDTDQQRLVQAMGVIEQLLGAEPEDRVAYILRPHQPGDMGWVVQRHGVLYNREYGWDDSFEALVAEIVARFIQSFEPKRERCWIAEKDGESVGCVFLVRKSERQAQLRLLLVEPKARGLGIGKRLVAETTRFARQVGYRSIMLWTNDVLHAARHLYEAEGYRLVKEEAHHSFGHDLVGQFWELEL
jgi:DNA-binding MarR family transcriptional regulator/N-acetylglutamate synthase-like GNAT family acetyltransferase